MDFDALNTWLGELEEWLWSGFGIGIVGLVAIYFTFRTKAVQFRMIPAMFSSITEKSQRDESAVDHRKSLSAFQAFTISAAARVGTGNISGVAGAIFIGGPGAVVWMWIMCLFTSAASFIESTLAQLYKSRAADTYKGGPAFYIHRGLGSRWFGGVFAVLFIFCFALAFTSLQANTIVDAVDGAVAAYTDPETMPWISVVMGLLLAAATALVVIGGMRRVARVAQSLVPLMALVYLVVGLFVVLTNSEELPRVINQMFTGAFNAQAIGGGAVGAAIIAGVQRGMLSNEAGMGSVPNVAATASVSHPVKQGLVQTLGVYFDTLLVCSITAFMVLVAFPDVSAGGEGLVMVQESLISNLGAWGAVLLAVILLLVAFTSVLGNYSYGEANMNFLTRTKGWHLAFGWAVTLMVFVGAVIAVDLAWSIAGVSMVVIAAINLVVIALLGKPAMKLLRHYQAEVKAGYDPVFLASDLPEIENIECWAEEDVMDVLDARRGRGTTGQSTV